MFTVLLSYGDSTLLYGSENWIRSKGIKGKRESVKKVVVFGEKRSVRKYFVRQYRLHLKMAGR